MSDDSKKIIQTPKFRSSFCNVENAKPNKQGKKLYSLHGLFTDEQFKNDPLIKEMKALAQAAAVKKFGARLKDPEFMKEFKNPFKNGARKASKYKGYEGHWYVTFSSEYKPGIADKSGKGLIVAYDVSPTGFYSGCYARAQINCYAFDASGNYGVAFGLQGLQKMGDGEPFGFNNDPTAMFESVEGEEGGDGAYQEPAESMFG